ncbi:hypothetical protein [Bacillus cereus]|uniref:hypothetical protein n=1 Tax=Bacillus cereus TaxID=1396 RepID=UPI00240674E7|nr:hypothetical protein [Bacillus cereus]MDF9530906.1 hypothetical protein [Bacillus cereus]MDG1579287.1 hypothetical protein [Bacillus cereus]
MLHNQNKNINYYSDDPNYNLQHHSQYPHSINNISYHHPYHQNYTYPIYNDNFYFNNNQKKWIQLRNLDIPNADLFRKAFDNAIVNNFEGGFPTFRTKEQNHHIYPEIVLINPGYGENSDIQNLDPSPVNFAVHIRNVDRALRDDPRYLGGFPNFHVSSSGILFGATRLFKNAGERRWIKDSELMTDPSEPEEYLMIRAQDYAQKHNFAGGFPSFEHRSGTHELILLNNNAATSRYEKL